MKKIKTIAKNLFGAKRMKTLALMLLCGTIATYAQNAGHRGCNLGIYRHEQRGAGCQEEDNDGRWRMYLPCRSSPGSASVLRYLTYRSSNRDTSCQQ